MQITGVRQMMEPGDQECAQRLGVVELARKYLGSWRIGCGRSGNTAIEYALVAGSIAVVIVGVVMALGGEVLELYIRMRDAF